jgi:hypothetical protein
MSNHLIIVEPGPEPIWVPGGTSDLNWGPTNQSLGQTLLKYEPLPSGSK